MINYHDAFYARSITLFSTIQLVGNHGTFITNINNSLTDDIILTLV